MEASAMFYVKDTYGYGNVYRVKINKEHNREIGWHRGAIRPYNTIVLVL